MTAVPVTTFELPIPPSDDGSGEMPTLLQLQETVTVIAVPLGSPTRLDGLVVTEYEQFPTPALVSDCATLVLTVVDVEEDVIASRAPSRAAL